MTPERRAEIEALVNATDPDYETHIHGWLVEELYGAAANYDIAVDAPQIIRELLAEIDRLNTIIDETQQEPPLGLH
ncbi:MAG: hypothetical protein M3440_08455 [Chloroflexota bacterium]|nr:hypothetical protein [Chloroflexota bacterium]